jgi:hypothetical protein
MAASRVAWGSAIHCADISALSNFENWDRYAIAFSCDDAGGVVFGVELVIMLAVLSGSVFFVLSGSVFFVLSVVILCCLVWGWAFSTPCPLLIFLAPDQGFL